MRNFLHLGIRVVVLSFFALALTGQQVEASPLHSNSEYNVQDEPIKLKDAISKIEAAFGYTFAYSANDVNVNLVVNYTSTEDINTLLNGMLSSTPIAYAIKGKQIILTKKVPFDLKMKVVDQKNAPIAGATVIVLGTTKGGISMNGGELIIDGVVAGNQIEVSCMGYEPQIITASSLTDNVVVKMNTSDLAIQEVVVTGYQVLSKERATGSFATLGKEQLEKPADNIASRIIGTSAGVQSTIGTDGEIKFEIRGLSTLSDEDGAGEPLVVVDGFPIQGSMSSINPNDVESITILKDAAAASIWGAKSANGVIVVTTKSGKGAEKGTKIEFSTFLKFAPKIDYDYYNPMATSAETIEYETIAFNTNMFGGPWSLNTDSNSSVSSLSTALTIMNENRLGYISDSEMDSQLAYLSSLNNSQQIKDLLMQNPFTQQYNINISSVGDRSTQNVSMLYEGAQAGWIGNDSERFNVAYRNNTKVFKWLDFSLNANFDLKNTTANDCSLPSPYAAYGDYPNTDYPQDWSPYDMILNEDGSRAYRYKYYMPNLERYLPLENFAYSNWGYNALDEMEAKDYNTQVLNYRIQAGLTAKIIKGLTFDSKIQYENITTTERNYTGEGSYAVRSEINYTSTWDRTTNAVTQNLPSGGFLDQSKSTVDYYNWRNQLNYNRTFKDKHQIAFVAGTEISDRTYQTTAFARTYGYSDDRLTVGTFPNGTSFTGMLGWPSTVSYTNSYGYYTQRYFSMFANMSYTFDKKYTLTGSYRTDASNMITDDPAYRYSPFWSVGGSWNATNEDFLKDVDWLDRLIVRATYGVNGNVDTSTSFMPLISIGDSANKYTGLTESSISSYGNPTLRWEKTYNMNLGVDFDMMNGKLRGSVDVYNKKGKDLIVSMSIPSTAGTTSQKLNAAEMTNKGIEIELGSTILRKKDFSIDVSGTFAYNYNMVDELFKTTYSYYELSQYTTSAYMQGHNANTLWSYEYLGLVDYDTTGKNPDLQPAIAGPNGTTFSLYGYQSGDASEYMLDSGTSTAPYSYSFSSNIRYKNFDFGFIFTGKFGHVFRSMSFNYPATGTLLPNSLYSEYINADPSERVPIPVEGDCFRYYNYTDYTNYMDYLIDNAGHLRCQELSLSYTLPTSLVERIGLGGVRVYAQGNNLFVLTNNRYNEDPEYPMGSIKLQASYTLGLNINF